MRILLSITLLCLTSVAMADNHCAPGGCKDNDDSSCDSCTVTTKKVDVKKTCFNIEKKKVCIPPSRFPWESSPCDGVCDDKCAVD